MAPPPISTTTVRGLAAATARISATCSGGRARSVRSPAAKSPARGSGAWLVIQAISRARGLQHTSCRRRPSTLSSQRGGGISARIGAISAGWMCSPSSRQSRPATTTAASQRAARCDAQVTSSPASWAIVSAGAALRRPSSGVTTQPGWGLVSEEPRSPRLGTAARRPMTAREPRPVSGNTAPSLRSITIDSRAARRARARWAGQPRREMG